MRAAVLLGLGAWSISACQDDPGFFVPLEPYGIAECDRTDDRLAGMRELRLYWNGAVDLAASTRGLQRYYRRHALRFWSSAAPVRVEQDHVLDTEVTGLSAALAAAFPGVDLEDEEALTRDPALREALVKYTLEYVLRPLVTFVRRHSEQGDAVTNLVALPQLQRPGGRDLSPPGTRLAALAVSPGLIAALTEDGSPEAAWWKAANFPARFTPVVFLDEDALAEAASRVPTLRDVIVAHELGHTGSLVHTTERGNLMTPGQADCTARLTSDQLVTLASALRVTGTTSAAAPVRTEHPRRIPPASLLHDCGLRSLLHPLREGHWRMRQFPGEADL